MLATIPDSLDSWTPDAVEQALVRCEAAIARLRAAQTALVAAADRAQLPTADGSRTLIEWTAARTDIATDTARHLVTAARLLADQPDLAAEFDAGEITFDRAVATARLAATGADPRVVERSRGFDLAGVARLTARHRRHTAADERATFADRHLVIQPNLDRSTWRLWGELPAAGGAVVDTTLNHLADTLPEPPDGMTTGRSQRRADALVALCQPDTEPAAGAPTAAVFVDTTTSHRTDTRDATATVAAGPAVGPAALAGILCDATIEITDVSDPRRPLAVGRRRRTLPPRLRRYLLWRDAGCTIDGCTSTYRLQPHHITPRAHGGTHHPDNLTTLCWYHHHIVIHGSGYRLDPHSPPQRRRLLPPPTTKPPPQPP